MLPAAFINPGDVTLMTVPGYPVAGTHTKYYGGEVHRLPLMAENDFLPDLESIPADIRRRAKLLVINYPNSPTGKVATREFYARVVDFATKNEIVVVQDAAHVMLSYDDRPLSFLEVPGAREVGVEVHSLSKGWNMIGWRMGWVCGHERIVRAFGRRERQLRLRPVHRHPKGGRRRAGRSVDPAPRSGKIRPPLAKTRRHAPRMRLRLPNAGRNVFPLCPKPEGHGRRAMLRHGRGRVAIPDHRAFDLHGALGRCRAVSCGFRSPTKRPTKRPKTP